MSRKSRAGSICFAVLFVTVPPLMVGCSSVDYLNHRDRVTLAGGDAVRQNLERETMNPSKASMYKTAGLGSNGNQIPAEPEAAATAE